MCGIVGKLNFDPSRPVGEHILRRMSSALRHRGPDDEGIWMNGSVGMASRRLAIIDLSPRAHMPMTNEDGSLWVVLNGEIYNFQDLRKDLQRKGHVFRSESDTEVILHLYEEHGARCLEYLRGMFAFALWDATRHVLFLARDRVGEKPLYYYHDAKSFFFASEPKAILQDSDVGADADPAVIHHFLTYGYVPGMYSAFKGIHRLPASHYLLVQDGEVKIYRYWSLKYTPKLQGTEEELGEELLALLTDAVRLRLISDVPVGAFLSGGLDSSTIVALMRTLFSGKIKTFSVGFEHPEYDERSYARQVAERFETDHHEVVITSDVLRTVPRLVWHYNEPFADPSALPSFALCETTRDFVTVALNGDGGDEAFLGYDRYLGTVLAEWYDSIPLWIRLGLARAAGGLPQSLPKSRINRLHRFMDVTMLAPQRRYGQWMIHFSNSEKDQLYTAEFGAHVRETDSLSLLERAYKASDAPNFLEASADTDVQLYLPDDLLVKMDIASMAHSLEVRSPILDHKVLEFAACLPPTLKLRGLTRKYLLKKVMRNVLPQTVINRRKMGFAAPIHNWLRHEMREMAHDLLLDPRSIQRGYFRPETVTRYLDEHRKGHGNHHFRLWNLVMLELWHRMFIDQKCPGKPPVHDDSRKARSYCKMGVTA
jgi:asparagine synthase (glutamine-hydrolysing)